TLSYRDVEELLAEHGIETSYETVQRWVTKFGPAFARNLRRLRPRLTSTCWGGRPPVRHRCAKVRSLHLTWHLDEMVVSIQGRPMDLWHAVDSEGEVLDLLVQAK